MDVELGRGHACTGLACIRGAVMDVAEGGKSSRCSSECHSREFLPSFFLFLSVGVLRLRCVAATRMDGR